MKDMIKYPAVLAFICVIAALCLAGINMLTFERIVSQAENEESNGLKEIIPWGVSFEPVHKNGEILFYKTCDSKGLKEGLAFKVKAKGYSSDIETIAGMTVDGVITGIKILYQNETPGLGSRICEIKKEKTIFNMQECTQPTDTQKPWFQEQFANKKIQELNDIPVITGATISSRAVIEAVKNRAEEILLEIKNITD